jgi:cation transport ATPase
VEVAAFAFRRGTHLPAAATVRRLQRAGLRVFLASGRKPDDAARVARQLGTDAFSGGVDDRARAALLCMLHERDVAVVHVRNGAALPHVRDNYVSVGLTGPDGIRHDADVAMLSRSISALPALVELARENTAHTRQDRQTIVAVNVLAASGVFAFGFTGLMVVLISNLGTYIVRQQARQALLDAKNGIVAGAVCEICADDPDDAITGPRRLKVPEPEQMRVYA